MNEKVKSGINKAYWYGQRQTLGSNNIKLKPYPKYKDSGIKRIGWIPEGWEAERYKIRFKYVKGKIPENLEETNEEGYLPYLSMEYLRGNGKGILCANDPKSIKVSEGDLLLLWDGSNAGEFVLGKKGYLSSTMVKLNVENFNSNFSWYLCKSFEPLLRDLTIGMGIPHVNGDTLGNIRIPVPNPEDQTAIANFLDKKTAKIDSLIEKDKKLIALLKEKRTALINHAVTKGLDPNVKLKDSGIGLIGKIPEEWEVRKLKFLLHKKPQYGANSEPESNENKQDIRYVRITDIDNLGNLRKDSLSYLSKEDARGFELKEGDILFARSGATVGKVYYYTSKDGECCYAGYLIRYVTDKTLLNSKFLYYYSLSKLYKEWINLILIQSTIENVSAEKYNNLMLSISPIPEQQKIVEYLDKATSKIDKTIKLIEKKINLLQEFKKSLIHYVVTGKVDVRGVGI